MIKFAFYGRVSTEDQQRQAVFAASALPHRRSASSSSAAARSARSASSPWSRCARGCGRACRHCGRYRGGRIRGRRRPTSSADADRGGRSRPVCHECTPNRVRTRVEPTSLCSYAVYDTVFIHGFFVALQQAAAAVISPTAAALGQRSAERTTAMTIKISDTEMTSDVTRHTRRTLMAGGPLRGCPADADAERSHHRDDRRRNGHQRAHILANPSSRLWWHMDGWRPSWPYRRMRSPRRR